MPVCLKPRRVASVSVETRRECERVKGEKFKLNCCILRCLFFVASVPDCNMAPFDKSKRSLVKHRTHKPFNGPGERSGGQSRDDGTKMKGARGGRGFQVGPRHAPDGAYLGKGE